MPDGNTLSLFLAATLALNVTPGPDMLYVIGRSVADGVRAGVISTFGISAGILIHIGALAAGIATLIATTPIAYDAVRLGGAAYLVWLGIAAFRRSRISVAAAPMPPAALRVVFFQGVLTSTLNPKIALFFLALLPQFTDPARGDTVIQLLILGLLFNVSGTIVNLLVALATARAVVSFASGHAASSMMFAAQMKRITGVLFIALGARMALLGR